MKRQAVVLSGVMALVGGCVIGVPGVLDAGGEEENDGDTGSNPGEGSSDGMSDEADEGETGEAQPEPEPEPEPEPLDGDGCAEALDILVVVDNSGSMGEFQRHVTDAFPLLIDGLDQAGVDWRLAVTTTDSGNMWCPTIDTTPEYGSFVSSACNARLEDFLTAGLDVDVQDFACNDICDLEPEQLETLPTYTDTEMLAKPRPWLQREAGQLNLAAGIEVGDAVRCLLPQGIRGCGFEQPLESMRRALARTTSPNLPEAGFLRDDASLLVLLVTDEADCSIKPELEEAVFSADGERMFWSDPNDNYPTSAVCWNAGVDCIGDPSGYEDCVAVNKDVFGQLPAAPEDAVLYPVTRYQGVLSAIEQSKRAKDPGLDVAVLAVTGVGLDGTFHYADVGEMDPDFQKSFGIGPGCSKFNEFLGEPAAAVPPVRIREVAEHMTTDPFYSICSESFDGLMLDALERFVGGC